MCRLGALRGIEFNAVTIALVMLLVVAHNVGAATGPASQLSKDAIFDANNTEQQRPLDAGTHRVMLLHGVWHAGVWDRQFQSSVLEALGSFPDTRIELTQYFIGFDEKTTPDILVHHREHLALMMANRQYEALICTLPAACKFAETLNIPSVHIVMVAPFYETEQRVMDRSDVSVIRSAARSAALGTLRHIQAMRPNTHVHFLSGSGPNDRHYTAIAKDLVAEYGQGIEHTFHVATEATSLRDVAASLESDRDTAFLLTAQAYGHSKATAFPVGSLASLGADARVPVFVSWDGVVGLGNIVGGVVTNAESYGEQAAEIIFQMLNGEPIDNVTEGRASAIYDAPGVDRWQLDMSRLSEPYALKNKVPDIWETNPNLVLSSLITAVMMACVIVLLVVLLRTSRRTSAELAIREEAALRSEAKYRAVADNSTDVIWTYEPPLGKFTYISPAILESSGFTTDEFLDQPLTNVIAEESLQRLNEAIGQRQSSIMIELEHVHRDGHKVPFEHSIQVVRNERGQVIQLSGAARDIRERRRQLAEKQQVEEQVRQRQKMESLGNLAAGIAHDFNNVLGVIVGLTDLLALRVKSDAESKALVDRQIDATHRAQRLVSQILTFTRKSQKQRSLVDINELLSTTVRHVEAIVPVGARYQFTVADQCGQVMGDMDQLEQVFVNLLTNAVEALPEDGGDIEVSVRQSNEPLSIPPQIGSPPTGHYALIEIRDNGGGIPEAELTRLFEPFYTTKALGSGIGLAIAHNVVTEHEGAIVVDTHPDEGTCFKVYLPIARDNVQQLSRDVSVDSQSTTLEAARPLKVLLIDDQEELLSVLESMTQSLGHECITCGQPKAATAMIDQHADDLDLVITDYSMPDVSGIDIIDYCQEHHPGLVTLLTSGYAAGITEAAVKKRGASGLLSKPMKLATYRRALANVANSLSVSESAEKR